MSERERARRPEPARTNPVRNVVGVFQNGNVAPEATATATTTTTATGTGTGTADAPAGHASASNPFAWSGDDPVSRAVRAGCDVVEQAVRRGFGLGSDPSTGPAWAGGIFQGPWAGPWTTGQWVDAMTGAFTQWAQWMDAWSSMARSAMGGSAEPGSGSWPPGARPASPSAATAGALRLTVELRTSRAVTVQLDLAPGAATAFEVHGLLAPAAAGAPPITDVKLAIAGGGVTVTLGSLEPHPAGTYAGAVLSAGRACGTLTVQLT